jgi:hypothetical protein
VEGVTKEQYGRNLEANLQALHARWKEKRYRHQPMCRVHIPKAQGKTRPIGLAAFEDKLVQDAVREVLEAMYEQDFLDCSYGFRPGRGAHGAVCPRNRIGNEGKGRWILEADMVSFFDSVDRNKLKEMLGIRVADGSLLRLSGKCLHVGVLDGETGAARRAPLRAGDAGAGPRSGDPTARPGWRSAAAGRPAAGPGPCTWPPQAGPQRWPRRSALAG